MTDQQIKTDFTEALCRIGLISEDEWFNTDPDPRKIGGDLISWESKDD